MSDDEWARAEQRARDLTRAVSWAPLLAVIPNNPQAIDMETSEILARLDVQTAIGNIIAAAATDAGIAPAHVYRIRAAYLDRIEQGMPVPSAIALVETVRAVVRDARLLEQVRQIHRDAKDELSKPAPRPDLLREGNMI